MRASLACFCLIIFSLAAAADKPPVSPATLADLSWLAGDWRGSDDDMMSQEVWTAPSGDSMLGMWRHFERTGVAWEDRNQPWVLPLEKVSDGEAVFVSAITSRGSLRIVYKRQADGSLVVEVTHGDGGPSTYTFRRAS